MKVHRLAALLLFFCAVVASAASQTVEYIPFSEAEPVLNAYLPTLPSELKPFGKLNADAWSEWAREQDKNIRGRLEQGQDDSLTNLLRFGVTYTKEPPITAESLAEYGKNSVINGIADRRANDLIVALTAPHLSPHMEQMRTLLEKRGYKLKLTYDQQRVKGYLLANLAHLRSDIMHSENEAKAKRDQALKYRGIVTDSDLFADYLLEQHLQRMMQQRLLKPDSIHRVAIVGPGLDFVNENSGTDLYPPQVTQPFAVIDSLAHLGLADASHLEVVTFDIAPRVNDHLRNARRNAAAGKPYTIQLLSTPARDANKAYVAGFSSYCEDLGKQIGTPAPGVSLPAQMKNSICNRAVVIKPAIVNEVTPLDMDVVFQTISLPADKQFDLVIATNVFDYYGDFDQSLARANLGGIIKPGGFLLSTEALPDSAPSKLAGSVKSSISIAGGPSGTEYMYSYVRK